MRGDEYPFNDDLLIGEGDQATARSLYGAIAEALIFPELVAIFKNADVDANLAKRRVHRWGLASITMVTTALLVASGSNYYEDQAWAGVIVLGSALLGIVGSLAGFGVFSSGAKSMWLENRLVTESLRQFHYRLLIQNAGEIVAACGDSNNDSGALQRYHLKRVTLLTDFAKNVIARKSAEFDALMERADERLQPEIESMPSPTDFSGPWGEKLLQAYQTLRLLRQRQFSDYKLRDDGRLFSKFPRAQAKVLGWVGIGCILAILGLDVFAAGKAIFHSSAHKAETGSISNISHQLAIWIALLALAIRAIEEGLKPRAEIERYRHYQAVTERLLERYSHSDNTTKIEIMRAMEHAAYDEMVIFLRSYHESRFVM